MKILVKQGQGLSLILTILVPDSTQESGYRLVTSTDIGTSSEGENPGLSVTVQGTAPNTSTDLVQNAKWTADSEGKVIVSDSRFSDLIEGKYSVAGILTISSDTYAFSINQAFIVGSQYPVTDHIYYLPETIVGKDGLTDAPVDGNFYARVAGDWSKLSALTEAPSDGTQYVRKDETWVHPSVIPNAPSDGKMYARNNGEWVEFKKPDPLVTYYSTPAYEELVSATDGTYIFKAGSHTAVKYLGLTVKESANADGSDATDIVDNIITKPYVVVSGSDAPYSVSGRYFFWQDTAKTSVFEELQARDNAINENETFQFVNDTTSTTLFSDATWMTWLRKAGNGTGVNETAADMSGFSANNAAYCPYPHNATRLTTFKNLYSLMPRLKTLDLTYVDTSTVTSLENAFAYDIALETLDLTGVNAAAVTTTQNMFKGCANLKSLIGGETRLDAVALKGLDCDIDLSGLDIDRPSILAILNGLKNNNTSATTHNVTLGVALQAKLQPGDLLDAALKGWSVDGSTAMKYGTGWTYMDTGGIIHHSESTKPDVTAFQEVYYIPNNLTTYSNLFKDATNLVAIYSRYWSTSSLASLISFCKGCTSLSIAEIGSFDTSKVSSFTSAFADTSIRALDLSAWNTEKATNMANVFLNCGSLASLIIRGWNTSLVTNLTGFLSECTNLTTIDISGFRADALTSLSGFGYHCPITSLIGGRTNTTESVFVNLSVSANFSSLPSIDRSSARAIINGLKDLTSQSSASITFHASVRALLTAEDTALITSKNWTLE